MAVKRAINYPSGAVLLLYSDGKKRYIPSPAYKEKRQQFLTPPKQFKGNPDTDSNCFRLLAAVLGYSLDKAKNPFKKQLVPEASHRLSPWSN